MAVSVNSTLTRSSVRQLPRVVVATSLVVACPAAVVLGLGAAGIVTSTIALSLIAVALSLAISYLGEAAWKRRSASGDLLFGDLMLWGWLRRWRFERLFSHATALAGPGSGTTGYARRLSRARRARLLERLSRALEARDPRTHGHSRRVARHAAAIAKRMGLPADQVARIRAAGVLHDVGKIDTPKEIIDKRGPLTAEEYEVVKRHAAVGGRMVASLGDPELAAVVRHHHERLDGGGYPDGLVGERIPLGSRIIAVADTFDAVTSARPYRKAMAHKRALALLDAEAGVQLDPDAVRAFRRYYGGHRPVVLWAALLALPRQAGLLLFDLPRFGSALTTAKVAAASLATVAVGTAVVHPATPVAQPAAVGPRPAPALVAQPSETASQGSTAARDRGERNGGEADAVEVSNSGPAEVGTPTEPSSDPAAAGDQPSATSGDGGESAAASPSTPSSPPAKESSSGSSETPVATTPPPAEPTLPSAAPSVTSTVESTLESVGSTVNQVTSPTLESVGGIVQQTTGGLLGGGKK